MKNVAQTFLLILPQLQTQMIYIAQTWVCHIHARIKRYEDLIKSRRKEPQILSLKVLRP